MAKENGGAVPKFGEWNDREATAPSNYTVIFNQVRQEREEAAAPATTLSSPRSNANITLPNSHQNHKTCCCFPWKRK